MVILDDARIGVSILLRRDSFKQRDILAGAFLEYMIISVDYFLSRRGVVQLTYIGFFSVFIYGIIGFDNIKMLDEFNIIKLDANDTIHKKQVEIRKLLTDILKDKGVEI